MKIKKSAKDKREIIHHSLPHSSENEVKRKRGRPKTINRIVTSSSQLGTKVNETRATFIVDETLLEKLKALAYWKRRPIKSLLQEALEAYLKGVNTKQIHQAEKAYKEAKLHVQ